MRDMGFAGQLVLCATVLHNMSIDAGDDGRDLDNGGLDDPEVHQDGQENQIEVETRRQQLLRLFQ